MVTRSVVAFLLLAPTLASAYKASLGPDATKKAFAETHSGVKSKSSLVRKRKGRTLQSQAALSPSPSLQSTPSPTLKSGSSNSSDFFDTFLDHLDDLHTTGNFSAQCQDFNKNLEGSCAEPCVSLDVGDSLSSTACSLSCDVCSGSQCTLYNNFSAIHDGRGDYIDFICKIVATETSPWFGFEYCFGIKDPLACQATLNGEVCQSCDLSRSCDPDQELSFGRYIDCGNIVPGNIHNDCAAVYSGVYEIEFAVENSKSLFYQCPSKTTEKPRPGIPSPVSQALPTLSPSPVAKPIEEQKKELHDRCTARRDLLIEFSDFLGASCGSCEYEPRFGGYALSCPQACDECYAGECLRLNSVRTIFSNKTDSTFGSAQNFCQQVSTRDSPVYGIEYCIDHDDFFTGFCNAKINGLHCETCYTQTCTNGNRGLLIDCSNVIPGTFYDQCSGQAGGVFTVQRSVETLLQAGTPVEPQCPSLLDELPPTSTSTPSTYKARSPWQCGPTMDFANDGFTCFNRDNPAFPLNSSLPLRSFFQCATPITDDPTLESCESSCYIRAVDEEGNLGRSCSSCTLLESGNIAYSCSRALPDLGCPARDEDLNCVVWDCIEHDKTSEYPYHCRKVGNAGYPLDNSVVDAVSTFFCSEPLGLADKPSLLSCSDHYIIRDTNLDATEDGAYCETTIISPDGVIAYDCANIFPDIECPVRGTNGACLRHSQPRAFCGGRRHDGSWLCVDDHLSSYRVASGLPTFFSCNKETPLFINLDECQSECFIVVGEFNPDVVLELDGSTCNSCTLLPNGKIAYDCLNIADHPDFDCPARDQNGSCYSTPSPTPLPGGSMPVQDSKDDTALAGSDDSSSRTALIAALVSTVVLVGLGAGVLRWYVYRNNRGNSNPSKPTTSIDSSDEMMERAPDSTNRVREGAPDFTISNQKKPDP